MKHLEEEVRPMTTHKTIVELIKEGKIKMVKDKPYSQTDYLVIIQENQFNRTYTMLTELENFMDTVNGFIHINNENLKKFAKYTSGKEHLNYIYASEFERYFVIPYLDLFKTIFQNILIRIIRAKISDKDKLILSGRTLDLLNKLMPEPYYRTSDTNSILRDEVSSIRSKFRSAEHVEYYKEYDIDLKILDHLSFIIEKFRKFND